MCSFSKYYVPLITRFRVTGPGGTPTMSSQNAPKGSKGRQRNQQSGRSHLPTNSPGPSGTAGQHSETETGEVKEPSNSVVHELPPDFSHNHPTHIQHIPPGTNSNERETDLFVDISIKHFSQALEPRDSSRRADSTEESAIPELPENVVENLLKFVDLKDLRPASLVCSQWHTLISDENGEIWRNHCIRRMSRDVLHSELLSTCPTYKAKLRAYFHSWNPQDCSRNIFVKPNGFTIHRNPVAQSTDSARSKIGFNKGRHAWEIIWEGPLGTVAVVGVATQQAEMRAQGYIALLGKDDQSWGWNLVENVLVHNGDSQGHYPLINDVPRYQIGERIRVILDCENNTLSFEKNLEFLGVAFLGLPQKELLYPAVSAVYGNTEISMVYLGPP